MISQYFERFDVDPDPDPVESVLVFCPQVRIQQQYIE